jgi:ribosomal peptide maturation radical SAM protein 1
MPFADYDRPSFALSQLCALVKRDFASDVDVEVHYLNVDFACKLGSPMHKAIAEDLNHLLTGVGDWLFREVAFPAEPDNSVEYFRRYYRGTQWATFRQHLIEWRGWISEWCAEAIDNYDLASADVVGFTSMFAQTLPSIAMARLIKERNPDVVTAVGGANCEAPMGAVLAERVPEFDLTFSGPALRTFPEVLTCLLGGDTALAHTIPGVLTSKNCHNPRFRTAVGPDRDIDDFVEPDYSNFVAAFSGAREQLAKGRDTPPEPVLFFETSRGCWWGERSHCTFCGLNGLGMNYRTMSSETAKRLFRWLFGFAPWCKRFACTDNIMPKNYPREVFAQLDPPPDVSVFYEVKLPVSERDLGIMARSRVNQVQPGIESLSTSTLRLMGKGTTAFQNIQFLKNCVRYPISPGWQLLIGFPGEDEAVYQKYAADIPLLAHLPPPLGAVMVRFDRYSPYFARRHEFDLDLHPMDFYRLNYPYPDDALAHLAYYFSDRRVSPYVLNAIDWIRPLNQLTEEWSAAWRGRDEPPRLELAGDADGRRYVYDSRSDEPRTIEIGPSAERTLRRLSSSARVDRLAAELDLPQEEVTELLAYFQENQLLFREGGQVISLVLIVDSPITTSSRSGASQAAKLAVPEWWSAPQPEVERT